ncbi:MAG TPA: tol-pal system protein YbgF [Gallionella sp.]|nr:tol-pal system protein YbgF [Gallionella sp.]
MLRQRALLLLSLFFVAPAQAGLFSDDEAHKQIQLLEARLSKVEAASEQQTKSMLDLLTQIETLNGEMRKLRGQNEELVRGLQDAEKREKDFYVDLDTRVRHFESSDTVGQGDAAKSDSGDTAQENRAYEAAYALFKAGNHLDAIKAFQEFTRKYPESVYVPNASYWLGNAQYAMKNYKAALETYRVLRKDYPSQPKDAEVLFNIAGCQQELKQGENAQKTLKLLISKYPDSDVAAQAKKQLASKK